MKKSTTEIVLQAVQDLHAKEQIVTRETLAEVTNFKLTVIDDRIGTLVDDGLVHRVQRGVFVPAEQHPPARPISKTILPNGMVKIEIGDEVLTLTPRESRMLAELSVGSAQQFASIEMGHGVAALAGDLSHRISVMERKVDDLGSREAGA
jgi:hypothetical protein